MSNSKTKTTNSSKSVSINAVWKDAIWVLYFAFLKETGFENKKRLKKQIEKTQLSIRKEVVKFISLFCRYKMSDSISAQQNKLADIYRRYRNGDINLSEQAAEIHQLIAHSWFPINIMWEELFYICEASPSKQSFRPRFEDTDKIVRLLKSNKRSIINNQGPKVHAKKKNSKGL
jgi:hypothetical protein